MKAALIAIPGLLLLGCTSSQQGASLTPEQAQTLAIELANHQAYAKFHCQPFQDGHPAHFVAGHWVWSDRAGVGQMDMEVTVELGANGSTNQINLKLLDNMNIISFRSRTTGGIP